MSVTCIFIGEPTVISFVILSRLIEYAVFMELNIVSGCRFRRNGILHSKNGGGASAPARTPILLIWRITSRVGSVGDKPIESSALRRRVSLRRAKYNATTTAANVLIASTA